MSVEIEYYQTRQMPNGSWTRCEPSDDTEGPHTPPAPGAFPLKPAMKKTEGARATLAGTTPKPADSATSAQNDTTAGTTPAAFKNSPPVSPINQNTSLIVGTTDSKSLQYLHKDRRVARAGEPVLSIRHISEGSMDTSTAPSTPTRPAFVRKKSGELVKPSLKVPPLKRTQSMPNTKNVQFDTNLVHVRRFNRSERPAAVSGVDFGLGLDDDGYSDDDETPHEPWHLLSANFSPPHYKFDERPSVYFESIYLSADNQSIRGHIFVKNLAFDKHVALRYTTDFWRTVREVEARFCADVRKRDRDHGYEKFVFEIPIEGLPETASPSSKTMFFCVRYRVHNTEFWDNNGGINYEVLLRRGNLHQNRCSHPPPRPRSELMGPRRRSADHSPDNGADFNSDLVPHDLDSAAHHMTQSDAFFCRPRIRQQDKTGFKSRYSFGAAYNQPLAAAAPAQGLFGPRPGTSALASAAPLPHSAQSDASRATRVFAPTTKPAWESESYEDIVSRYCFFTPTGQRRSHHDRSSGGDISPRSGSVSPPEPASLEATARAVQSLSLT